MSLTTKTDKELEVWIRNHEADPKGRSHPRYLDLLEERARRTDAKQRLKLDRSLAHLKQAAIAQRCTSYGELARASDIAWSEARLEMNGPGGHLDRLLEVCHARELPLLTAVCVNQENVEAGELGVEALEGFARCAERLGFIVEDARAFHHQQRRACWDWGRLQPAPSGVST